MENFPAISKRINKFYDNLDHNGKVVTIVAVASNIFWMLVNGSIFLKLLGFIVLLLVISIRVISKFGEEDGNSGNPSE